MTPDEQLAFEFFRYIAFHVTKALTALVQRDSFLFWPFVASALVVAIAVAIAGARAHDKRSWRARLGEYFSARVWWHGSARADYRLYIANALLLPALFGVLLVGDAHIVGLIDRVFGTASVRAAGEGAGVLARIAFTLVFFIAYDCGRFVAHCALHDIPVLWEFHKVHHSAETLTPMTTFRAHPVDLLVMAWVPVILTGAVTWVFNRAAGMPVSLYTYFGLHVVLFAFNLVALLRHTPVWLSYGPTLSKWLISPAQHQLHHSCEPNHLGCNRGFDIAVWDRLYGTLYVPRAKESFRLGLGDGSDGEWHNVRRMYWRPFVYAARRLSGPARCDRIQPPPSAPSA